MGKARRPGAAVPHVISHTVEILRGYATTKANREHSSFWGGARSCAIPSWHRAWHLSSPGSGRVLQDRANWKQSGNAVMEGKH